MTVSVNEVLKEYSRLAVLGDPGSGKTTLLRYLALLYARDLAEGTSLVQEKLGLPESGYLHSVALTPDRRFPPRSAQRRYRGPRLTVGFSLPLPEE